MVEYTSSGKQSKKSIPTKDLVGEEIRMKIKEIGTLWRNSPNNPQIDAEILKNWNNLIEEWIADKDMPLIIRKETSKRGQSFMHPSGREIIISDNTAAIWVYNNVLNRTEVTLSRIKDLLIQNELPMVFIVTKEIKDKAKYTKPLGEFAMPEWKLCHTLSQPDSASDRCRKRRRWPLPKEYSLPPSQSP